MNTAMATSLLDLLDKVPADARLSYEHSPTHHQMIPVGGLASAAAFRIRELEAERDRYHDALIARHGGEPIALLSELDEARAERDALRVVIRWIGAELAARHPDIAAHIDAALGTAETNLNDVKNVVSSF